MTCRDWFISISSKKLATSAAAKPLSFSRTLRFSSLRNRSNTQKNNSEVASVLLNATKLLARIIGELTVSSWSMEMLSMGGGYPTGNRGGDGGQECPYI